MTRKAWFWFPLSQTVVVGFATYQAVLLNDIGLAVFGAFGVGLGVGAIATLSLWYRMDQRMLQEQP